jgi:hypothetical protein
MATGSTTGDPATIRGEMTRMVAIADWETDAAGRYDSVEQ